MGPTPLLVAALFLTQIKMFNIPNCSFILIIFKPEIKHVSGHVRGAAADMRVALALLHYRSLK